MIQILVAVIAVLLFAGTVFVGWRLKLLTRYYWRKIVLLLAALLVGVAAGFVPLTRPDDGQVVTNTDIIFLVDTTYSMNAADGRDGEARLANVRRDIQNLSEKLAGSRFGIITFDSGSTIYLPLTATISDINIGASTVQTPDKISSTLDPSFQGALTQTKNYLDQVAKIDVTRQRVVVLMTDGELTGEKDSINDVLTAARTLQGSVNATVVIGYGGDSSAKLPYISTDFAGGYNQKADKDYYVSDYDKNGNYTEVITRRDSAFLRQLTDALRGEYLPAENIGDAEALLNRSRDAAARDKAGSPENLALQQNILHIPIAAGIAGLLIAVELVGWRPLQRLIAKKERT